MNLFYTIISQEAQPQTDPTLSLGGFCSASQVPSEDTNVLFSTVSQYGIEKHRPEYICICLKNIFERRIENITFWFEFDDQQDYQCKYRVAFSKPNGRQLEQVSSIYAKPVYATFDTANGIDDAISLPDMDHNDIIGIWIERTIDMDSEEIKNRRNCDWLYENRNVVLPTQESLEIKINFDD